MHIKLEYSKAIWYRRSHVLFTIQLELEADTPSFISCLLCVCGQNSNCVGLNLLTHNNKDNTSYPRSSRCYNTCEWILPRTSTWKYSKIPCLLQSPLFNVWISSSVLIQGPLQRLDCGGLNNLQKIIRQLFRYLHLQLYGTKETPPLSVKSVVYGKIDWAQLGFWTSKGT